MSVPLKKVLQSIIDNPDIKDIEIHSFGDDADGRDMIFGFGAGISDEGWLDKLGDHLKSLGLVKDRLEF